MKGDKDPNVRKSAAKALGEIGAPAVDSLIATLKDPDLNLRLYAAYALCVIDDPRAHDAEFSLGRFNAARVARDYAFFIEMGEPASEDGLIEALDRFGDLQMAAVYLNSGNPRMEAAGSRWGSEHGYETESVNNGAHLAYKWATRR